MTIQVGERIMLKGVRWNCHNLTNHGVVINAHAPGLRTVQWDDGTTQELPSDEIIPEVLR